MSGSKTFGTCIVVSILTLTGCARLYARETSDFILSKEAEENRVRLINEYIRGLNYTPETLLAYHGSKSLPVRPREGCLDESTDDYWITEHVVRSLSNGDLDLGVIASNRHRAYPGSLLLANSRLASGDPDLLQLERKPLRYAIDLPGLLDDDTSFWALPLYPDYKAALHRALKTWFEKYSQDHDIPAQLNSAQSLVHSKEQMQVSFGATAHFIEANIDFGAVQRNEKLVYVHQYQQLFYTVSVVAPDEPASVFGSRIDRSELVARGVDATSPPVLVDSVSYGRVLYVIIETSSVQEEAKAALTARFSNLADLDAGANHSRQLDNLSMRICILGGSSGQIDLMNVTSLGEVSAVIARYKDLGRGNLGLPFTYSTSFLRDHVRARVTASTEYVEPVTKIRRAAAVGIQHYGWYVTKWYITWDEVTIGSSGEEVVRPQVQWSGNGRKLRPPHSEYVRLPGNARNLSVRVTRGNYFFGNYWGLGNYIELASCTKLPIHRGIDFEANGDHRRPKFHVNPPGDSCRVNELP